ncbi:DUF7619 domain-containing protein [Hymenobacter busanensis]|uniref:DUF7619 domain-containing protein n=1 Tax=Hymenobacter busanensis TaxID=2607656 RepID=UPI0013670997|nr:T9SS type A sorting domain-containing protein [Hymenobacter busanensis]QHJ07818.1 T9SS type A sorting domain-containing protein [Hymenobacter busanensis]
MLIVLLGGSRWASAQHAVWARGLYPTASSFQAATDAAGNSYVGGEFRNEFHLWGFSCGGLLNLNDYDSFVAKFDAAGNVQWLLPASGTNDDFLSSITTDPAGNVYVAFKSRPKTLGPGTTPVPFTFGGQSLSSVGLYLAKISPAGVVQYLRYLNQGDTSADVTALAADAASTCYVAANGESGVTMGSFVFSPGSNASSSMILRADAGGTITQVQQYVPQPETNFGPYHKIHAMKLGPQGDLYCTGGYAGEVTFGGAAPVVLGTRGGTRVHTFVTRLSTSGNTQWALSSSTSAGPGQGNVDLAGHLALDAAGNAFVVGDSNFPSVSFGSETFNSSGCFTAKISAAGVPQWIRGAAGGSGFVRAGVTVDPAGNVYQLGSFGGPTTNSITFGSTTLISPAPLSAAGFKRICLFVVSYDAAGNLRWARTSTPTVPRKVPTFSNASQGEVLTSDAAGNLYVTGQLYEDALFDQEQLPTGGFVLRLDPAASLSGTVYLDQNGNGQRDTGEGGFPKSVVLTETNQQLSYSTVAGSGQYYVFGNAGAYNLALPNVPAHYTLSQAAAGYSGQFPAAGQTTSGLDFGLSPVANVADVRVTLTPYGAARPGFLTKYRVTLENTGTTTAAGTLSATLDARAQYVGSTPAGSASGNTVSWSYSGLAPFASRSFDVQFSLPINTALGTVLTSSATAVLAGDTEPADNTSTAQQTVTGSFDPNDMTVNYTQLTPQQVAARQPLDYTIRFQNMGTDTAFTVVVQDTLNIQRLQPGSLQLIAQSHNCHWSLTAHGVLTVSFRDIDLPARNTNVIASQGFVRFRVQPQPSLAAGVVIPNAARILFDYNAPVRTNTATTTVLMPTALTAAHTAAAWSAYPNPTNDAVTIVADLPKGGSATLQVLDALGRLVQETTVPVAAGTLRHTLNLQTVPSGVYVLRLHTPDGQMTSRRLVRQ